MPSQIKCQKWVKVPNRTQLFFKIGWVKKKFFLLKTFFGSMCIIPNHRFQPYKKYNNETRFCAFFLTFCLSQIWPKVLQRNEDWGDLKSWGEIVFPPQDSSLENFFHCSNIKGKKISSPSALFTIPFSNFKKSYYIFVNFESKKSLTIPFSNLKIRKVLLYLCQIWKQQKSYYTFY